MREIVNTRQDIEAQSADNLPLFGSDVYPPFSWFRIGAHRIGAKAPVSSANYRQVNYAGCHPFVFHLVIMLPFVRDSDV